MSLGQWETCPTCNGAGVVHPRPLPSFDNAVPVVTYQPGHKPTDPSADDDEDDDPEECASCDTPLADCPMPDAGCCGDCTHAANFPKTRSTDLGS